ncbi:GJ12915 [Ectocarpus siliculosus]|uniref:GJ12915 n=1 Tax=Ectocarpus siliculosus TaxID=2880 RepID=D8LEW5_ECTSI|nr:GJ12915 [Ectocarpus siliculosus]|eukprot:CBN79785.1 GJ12915 [Ectocarpus siliculosus]
MQDMFREFSEELGSPENAGKNKAEIEDIFSYTSVGHKHIVRNVPSEDRIAIHQAVVPTIDDKDRKDLDIDSIDTTPFAMFGVFDGHGGPACAEFLTQSVSTVLAHSPVLYDEDLTPTQRRTFATADSFEELEKVHNKWADEIGDLSGSTAILSTFQDGVLVMAGVGDSAGLYVDHMGKQHNLCPQHSTSNEKEVERVLSMGGTIVNNRVAGCLMPTRTIGDLDCKRALGAIVSPHPEITLAAIYAPPDDGEPHDEPFLVLASDGLWDVLSFAEVAFITRKGLRNLRAHEKQERAKAEKAAAKAAQAAAADGLGGGGGHSTGGKTGLWKKMTSRKETAAWMDGGRRSLDVSRAGLRDSSIRGLDASVRGGQSPVLGHPPRGKQPLRHSASLDSSLYAGLRAEEQTRMIDESLHEVVEGVPASYDLGSVAAQAALAGPSTASTMLGEEDAAAAGGEQLPPVKAVTVASTEQTASVRTAGSDKHNVAMKLVHAALRAESHDDISVVVVTFAGTADKSPPGCRTNLPHHLPHRSSKSSLSGSSPIPEERPESMKAS